MTRVAIQPDHTAGESYSELWRLTLQALGAEVVELDLLGADAMEQAARCDGVMWRYTHAPQEKQRARGILAAIEHGLGIPVFPDHRTAWHYDNKRSQHYLLRALGALTPETWVFWDEAEARNWARNAPYPVVFKLSRGAGSANVVRVQDRTQADRLITRAFHRGHFSMGLNETGRSLRFPRHLGGVRAMMRRVRDSAAYALFGLYPPLDPSWWEPEKGYVYFQEFVPGNSFDTRITVIGERAFGLRRFNRKGDFRASGSGNLDTSPDLIDRRMVQTAIDFTRRGRFQAMAYDFLLSNGEPVITEISFMFVARAVHSCPGYWTPDLTFHAEPMWPQEAQAADFLTQIHREKSRDYQETAAVRTTPT